MSRKQMVEYQTWVSMRTRCRNPRNKRFSDYGGRGIQVCKRWDSYENFLDDMGLKPSAEHSIERIDNDGDYEPGNCRWATQAEQNRNQRSNVMLTHAGKTQCMQDWADEIGVDRRLIGKRLKRGWSVEDTLTKEIGKQSKKLGKLTHNGKTQTVKEWAKEIGLTAASVYYRLSKPGGSISQIVEESQRARNAHHSSQRARCRRLNSNQSEQEERT